MSGEQLVALVEQLPGAHRSRHRRRRSRQYDDGDGRGDRAGQGEGRPHLHVLVGHSYGGMVATGVADRTRKRVRRLVYLDAFVPRDGQSLLDLLPPEMRERMRGAAKTTGGWRVPPNPVPPDTSEAHLAWLMPRQVMQPLRAFEEPLRLTGAEGAVPRTSIYCSASRLATCSARSPSARRGRQAGSLSSSRPATAPTSRRPRR